MSFGERIDEVAADGKITEAEVTGDMFDTLASTTLLERWGKVRQATGSVGGNRDFVDVAGVGRVEWQAYEADELNAAQSRLLDMLRERFVFPIYQNDSQRESDPGLTETDAVRARFEGEDAVVEDINEWADSASPASPSSTSTTESRSLPTRALVGIVALGIIIIGVLS